MFIFNHRSREFLERWHDWCLEIFDDPDWHDRDQGTLIATCWSLGLEQHPLLPIEYNFIADYYASEITYHGELSFSHPARGSKVHPYLLHIYAHFGDSSWAVWEDVELLKLSSPISSAARRVVGL